MIIAIIATTERLFHIIEKNILEKEKALNFYADAIFYLFMSLILLSSSCFLLSYFNKNVSETKFLKRILVACVVYKVSFLLVLFKYRGFSDSI